MLRMIPGVFALCCISVFNAQPSVAQEDRGVRSARAILKDLRSVGMPRFSDGNSPEAAAKFKKAIHDGCRRISDLALELYENYPDHREVPQWMSRRWASHVNVFDTPIDAVNETTEIIESKVRGGLRHEALYHRAWAALHIPEVSWETKLAAVRTYIDDPDADDRAPHLLGSLAMEFTPDLTQQIELAKECTKRYPKSAKGRYCASFLRSRERIGQPFPYEFMDAVTGQRIDAKDHRGHVVVVYFWGMGGEEKIAHDFKELSALTQQHEDLRVVGIFQAGGKNSAKELRARVAKHKVPSWPQHNEMESAKSFDDTFSWRSKVRRWPDAFVVDREGNLADVHIRGRIKHAVEAALAKKKL